MTKKVRPKIDKNIKRDKILYLHGFMSGANSMTVDRLDLKYGYIFEFVVPELNGDIDHSIKIVNNIIAQEKPRMIIGSSLGGFYALVCDSGDIPVLVVNPCVNPYVHMQQYLNKTLEYHCKRRDGEVSYRLTQDVLEHFKKYDVVSAIKSKGAYLWALLSTNDEILGTSHLDLFEKIREEEEVEGSKIVFISTAQFGHRAFPWGISSIADLIYAILWDN